MDNKDSVNHRKIDFTSMCTTGIGQKMIFFFNLSIYSRVRTQSVYYTLYSEHKGKKTSSILQGVDNRIKNDFF